MRPRSRRDAGAPSPFCHAQDPRSPAAQPRRGADVDLVDSTCLGPKHEPERGAVDSPLDSEADSAVSGTADSRPWSAGQGLSLGARAASWMSPRPSWASPWTCLALPRACLFLSPVNLPSPSSTLPRALLVAPLTCSSVMSVVPSFSLQLPAGPHQTWPATATAAQVLGLKQVARDEPTFPSVGSAWLP